MNYYIAIDGQAAGPFSPQELIDMGLTANSMLWNDTMPQWVPASKLPEFSHLFGGSPVAQAPTQPTAQPIRPQFNPSAPQATHPVTAGTGAKLSPQTIKIIAIVAAALVVVVLIFTIWPSKSSSSSAGDAGEEYIYSETVEEVVEPTSAEETYAEVSDGVDPFLQLMLSLDSRNITYDDISGYNKEELRVLRNSCYARHGYTFRDPKLTEYFSQFEWYRPMYSDVSSMLNEYEKANISFIKNHE